MKFKAAVIGLGNIGSLFDEDPRRGGVSSHVGAYLASPSLEIVAGADPEASKLERFSKRCPGARLYRSYIEMLADNYLDIVSICSPTASHFEILSRTVDSAIRAIFCEKPIASRVEDARQMVSICRKKKVILAINHTRRWDRNYVRVKECIDQGRIGEIKSIVGNYSDKVFMVGTHLIDMLRFYSGNIDWVTGTGENLESDDPGVSGFLSFRSGARGFITCNGKRENLVFEVDLMGTKGRLRLLDNGHRTEFFQFEESARYSGYQELKRQPLPGLKRGKSPLVLAIEDIVQCIETGGEPACSGEDGLKALEIASALCKSAKSNNEKVKPG